MTPFRIRERLRALLGREPTTASDPIPPPPPRPASEAASRPTVSVSMHGGGDVSAPEPGARPPVAAPPVANEPVALSPAASEPVPTPAPAPVEPAATPPATPPAGEAAVDADAAKQKRHWARTRKGMLKWLAEQGGSSPMKAMHDKAEAKYFVAHRSFSRLMEEFTEEGLVNYSGTTGLVELTDAGRAELG